MGVEQKLRPGLHDVLSGKKLEPFPDYSDEIRKFKPNGKPFQNQDAVFMRALQVLNTKYPYFILLGDAGNGKSSIIRYLSDLLSNKEDIKQAEKHFPGSKKLLEEILAKAPKFQGRDFLALPNFNDPLTTNFIAYTDKEKSERDYSVANKYCQEVSSLFGKYVARQRPNIRMEHTKRGFSNFVKYKVARLFHEIYWQKQTDEARDINIHFKEGKFELDVKGLEKKDEAKLRKVARKFMNSTIRVLNYIDIKEGKGYISKQKTIERRDTLVASSCKQMNTVLRKKRTSGELANREDFIDFINMNYKNESLYKLSPRSIDFLARDFKKLSGYLLKQDCSNELKSWMRDTENFFVGGGQQIYDLLETALIKVTHEETKGGTPSYDDINLTMEFGPTRTYLSDIFSLKLFSSHKQKKGYNIVPLAQPSGEDFIGSFKIVDRTNPPHMSMKHMGSIGSGGVLVIEDSFKDVVQEIARMGNVGMRKTFNDYLQTGKFSFSNKGIYFSLDVPKMIMAADNDFPFFSKIDNIERNEVGLKNRMTTIDTPVQKDNNKETRAGTIEVIKQTIEKQNATRSESNQLTVVVSDAAIHHFLQSKIQSKFLLSTNYRTLEKEVEEMMSYAQRIGKTIVDLEVIKRKTVDDLNEDFFSGLDGYKSRINGPLSRDSDVGHANGLGVSDSDTIAIPLQTNIIPSRDENYSFTLTDKESKLITLGNVSGKQTDKGFTLTGDYIKRILGDVDIPIDDQPWTVKTHFGGYWDTLGGPSASGAIAVSILSALSNIPVYTNRFMTGTLDSSQGFVERIGGVYQKSLAPWRVSDIKEDVYMIFPSQNFSDMSKKMQLDPFKVQEKVVCLPIHNIKQAFYLHANGSSISTDDWEHIDARSEEFFKHTKNEIKKNKLLKESVFRKFKRHYF